MTLILMSRNVNLALKVYRNLVHDSCDVLASAHSGALLGAERLEESHSSLTSFVSLPGHFYDSKCMNLSLKT